MTAFALIWVSRPNSTIACEPVSQVAGCTVQNCRISDIAVVAAVKPSETTASGVDRICNDEKCDSNNTVAPNQKTMRARNPMYVHLDDLSAPFAKNRNFSMGVAERDFEVQVRGMRHGVFGRLRFPSKTVADHIQLVCAAEL